MDTGTNKSIQNIQIPSVQGRAAEATASINSLISNFFDETSFDDVEDIFSDVTQAIVDPANAGEYTRTHTANMLFSISRISNLLRKLDGLNNELKGGVSC